MPGVPVTKIPYAAVPPGTTVTEDDDPGASARVKVEIVPLPVSATVGGGAEIESKIVRLPEKVEADVGVNVTLIVQDAPDASGGPSPVTQLSVSAKAAGTVIELITTGFVVPFVTVTI